MLYSSNFIRKDLCTGNKFVNSQGQKDISNEIVKPKTNFK